MNELQEYLLSAVKEITRVCDENGIDYMIAAGTVLGAVRHKGFIPWDDDIDLYMTLKNYKEFLKIGQKSLGDKFFVQNYHTEKRFFEMWTQIRCKGTTSMPVYLKDLDINWGICIDVFPIVGTSKDEAVRMKQQRALDFNRMLLSVDYNRVTGTPFSRRQKLWKIVPNGIRRWICKINEKNIFLNEDNCDSCTVIWWCLDGLYRSHLFDELLMIEFEDTKFKAMKNYDEFLTLKYGDYMTPPDEKDRNGHVGELGEIIIDTKNGYHKYK